MMPAKDFLLEKGWLPDHLIRWYVRKQCQKRIGAEAITEEERREDLQRFVQKITAQPIALKPDVANLQHYEVPTEFFRFVLGDRMKYSSCYWPDDRLNVSLNDAENEMLKLTRKHAEIEDGMDILELGCGWGSLSLFLAERFPNCDITAVSNSNTQRKFIEETAIKLGIRNLKVLTADMNNFHIQRKFDRVVTVEMFEHMRNWKALLSNIKGWLNEEGKLFIHIFTFDGRPYLYHANDRDDWMARNFFDSGMMPSPELIHQFSDLFKVEKEWQVNGRHYEKTLNAWLTKMDDAKPDLFPLFLQEYGREAHKYWNHWRVFFMACAEVFGYAKGEKWFVSHYLLQK